MNTWLVHIYITPSIRLPVEVMANSREEAQTAGGTAAAVMALPVVYGVEVQRIIS